MKDLAIEAGKLALQHTGKIDSSPYSSVVILVLVLAAVGVVFGIFIRQQGKRIDVKDQVLVDHTRSLAEANRSLAESLTAIQTAIISLDKNQQAGTEKIITAIREQEKLFLLINSK